MEPYDLILITRAKRDISRAIDWSEEQFGRLAGLRYDELIRLALQRVATAPDGPLVRDRGSEASGCFSLHLRHVPSRVKHPRHLLVFEVNEELRQVTVLRLLHEAMDFERQLEGRTPGE